MEAEVEAVTDAMHAAWQRLKMNTTDAQLRSCQEGMSLPEESAKCSSRSFLQAPRR